MRNRIALLFGLLTFLLVALACGSSPIGPGVGANVDPKIKDDELAALAGTWLYERQVIEGKEIPVAGGLSKGHIVIRGDSLVREVYRDDGERLTPIKSTISIDPTTIPKQMDDDASFPFEKKRRPGIYKLEGDRLTLCYNNNGDQRPTTFDSPVGSSFVLTVLHRQGK
jgi:uncharacterized protein (TIGR03067 family)